MRTHESVLKANYTVTESIEKKSIGDYPNGTEIYTYVKSYSVDGQKLPLMERRFIIHISADKQSANFKNQCNALGSYHEQESIEISREQFEYLKEIWK